MSLDGQQVVIIGASAGIGEATARAFAARGAAVTITGRSKERLDQAAQRIGWPVQVAEVDAVSRAALDAFFATAGQVDHLVLAASPGAVGAGPVASLDEDTLRQAFDGKFFAHVQALQAALPRLRADGSVTIVTAASARAAFAGTAALAAVNGRWKRWSRRWRWNSRRSGSTQSRPVSSTRRGGTGCLPTSGRPTSARSQP